MVMWLVNFLHYGLLAVAVKLLTDWLGVWGGIAVYLFIVSVCTLVAWWLLLTSESVSNRLKNYVAGLLLPWTPVVGGGSLLALLVKNAVASTVFGLVIVTCIELNLFDGRISGGAEASAKGSWSTTAMVWLTAAGWGVLLVGWIFLLKSFFNRRSSSEPISTLVLARNRILVPLMLPPVVLVSSIAMRYCGHLWMAFLTAWIPLLVILFPVIMMAVVLLACALTGKRIRWN